MKTGLRTLVEVGSAFVFLAGGIVTAAGCGETKNNEGIDFEDGSLQGVLSAYMSDDLVSQSEMRYMLRAPSGLERVLHFDHDTPDLVPGATLKVWGPEGPDGVTVTKYQITSPPVEERTSALQMGPAYADRAFAFVLVDVGGGVNITADTAMARMIGDANSIRNYYLYDSYGRQNISTSIFSLSYTMNGCDTGPLASALRPMVTGTFQHYLWYIGSRQTACAWAGLASVGTAQTPSRDTWYNASSGCVVLVQEPGHNFGMQHSSSIRCTGTPLSDDTTGCTASEYGDVFDPMGGGCRHMNAWQKAYQGWFGGCNGVNVTSSGTFTLLPYEMRCDGVQYLQIPAPKTRTIMRSGGGGGASTEMLTSYFLELRTPLDFDGTLGGNGNAFTTPRVLLHIANDVRSRNQRAIHPYLIDMTPATTSFNDAAMVVGQPFVDPDPAGPTITVMAVSTTTPPTATIQVTFPGGGTGAPTCLDDTTFTTPGPGTESCIANTPVVTGVPPLPGSGGAPGSGGRNGGQTGGRGGSTVTPGAGGMAAGGRPGSGGAGTGGAGNGTVGPGQGGSTVTGNGGSTVTHSGGAPTTTTGSGGAPTTGPTGPGVTPGDVTGGCGCAIESGSPLGLGGTLLFLGLVLRLTRNRRRRQS